MEHFGVMFRDRSAGRAPTPLVYPLGPAERTGERVCGLLETSRAEPLTPVLFPEPDRVLRFAVLTRPHDTERRGKPNKHAHRLADAFGLAANGLCPEGLWGPMLVVVPTVELAQLLVDYCTAPEATRDSDRRFRPLFLYDAAAAFGCCADDDVTGCEPHAARTA